MNNHGLFKTDELQNSNFINFMLRPRKIHFLSTRLIIPQKRQRTYNHVMD